MSSRSSNSSAGKAGWQIRSSHYVGGSLAGKSMRKTSAVPNGIQDGKQRIAELHCRLIHSGCIWIRLDSADHRLLRRRPCGRDALRSSCQLSQAYKVQHVGQ